MDRERKHDQDDAFSRGADGGGSRVWFRSAPRCSVTAAGCWRPTCSCAWRTAATSSPSVAVAGRFESRPDRRSPVGVVSPLRVLCEQPRQRRPLHPYASGQADRIHPSAAGAAQMPVLTTGRQRNRVVNAAWLTLAGLLALALGTLPARAADASAATARQRASSVLPATTPDSSSSTRRALRSDESGPPRQVVRSPPTPTAAADEPHRRDRRRPHQRGGPQPRRLHREGASRQGRTGRGPSTIRVCAEADPNRISNLRPGSYRGAVVVRAPTTTRTLRSRSSPPSAPTGPTDSRWPPPASSSASWSRC